MYRFNFYKFFNDWFTNHDYSKFADSFADTTYRLLAKKSDMQITKSSDRKNNFQQEQTYKTSVQYLECILCNERVWNEKHNCTMTQL